ncbi:MAG: hypothetical protein AB8B74_05320 [Crocinitomicaceae bacterium]
MVKFVFRIFFLIFSLAALAFGGYKIYEKQLFPITHESFTVDEGEILHISNLRTLNLKENGLQLLGSYGGEEWIDLLEKIAVALNPDSEVIVQISFSKQQSTLSIHGINHLELIDHLGIVVSNDNHVATLNNKSWNYWANSNFTVFSNQKIQPRIIKKEVLPYIGNADFFYEGLEGEIEGIKLTDKVKFSTFSQSEKLVKGRPVTPIPLLVNCPTSADNIHFFGSTRFNSDIQTLQNIDTVNHMTWVGNKMAYIQKDSFEIIIGQQNDEQKLRRLIEEDALLLSEDSLLKPSIYFNNIEIIPFDIDWNWAYLCKNIKSEMHYFANYNDNVFLANDLKSMYWILSSIQLGKTFDANQLKKSIPTRVNVLKMEMNNTGMAVSSKAWINLNRSINFSAVTNSNSQSNQIQLLGDFDHVNPSSWILMDGGREDLTIMSVNENKVEAFSLKGDLLWEVRTESEIKIAPLLVDINNDGRNELVLTSGKQIHLFNIKDQEKQRIPIEVPSPILKIRYVKNKSKSGYIIETKSGLMVFDSDGKPIDNELLISGGVKKWNVQEYSDESVLFVQSKLDSIYLKKSLEVRNSFAGIFKPTIKGLAPFLIMGQTQKDTKVLNYESGFIKIQYLNNFGIDSIKIEADFKVEKNYWVKKGSHWFLALEGYDKVEFFNTHALSELKIIKPEPNLIFMAGDWTEDGIFVFLNKETQMLFFIDEYGNLLMKNPIKYGGLFAVNKELVVTKTKSRIHVYNLK